VVRDRIADAFLDAENAEAVKKGPDAKKCFVEYPLI
jgi:hypothetical protein